MAETTRRQSRSSCCSFRRALVLPALSEAEGSAVKGPRLGSFVSQSHHRVDLRCPPRRDVTRQQSYTE